MFTLNVVEVDASGIISSLTSFKSDSYDEVGEAEALFCDLARDSTKSTEAKITAWLEEGYCKVLGGGNIQLVESR